MQLWSRFFFKNLASSQGKEKRRAH